MQKRAVLGAGILLALCLLAGCSDEVAAPEAEKSTQTAPFTVACVGDSNTEGYGATSYSVFLAESLGDGYAVENYGVSGTTAMESAGFPYASTAAYSASLEMEADITLLMLGTNDTADWRGEDVFAKEYQTLVQTYLDKNTRLILCTPPAPQLEETPGMVSFGIQPRAFDAINRTIFALAENEGLEVCDVYSLTLNHPEWFLDDGIHLADDGAEAVAALVAQTIRESV